MVAEPTLGEYLLGVEGLALLRLAFTDDAAARAARVSEVRDLVARLDGDPALGSAMAGAEFDLETGYASWSASYDRPLRLFFVEEPVMHELVDAIPPGVVLDAACGTGRYAAHLAGRGHDVIGVDQSEAMLALARAKVPDATFHHGDLTALPLADRSVDAIVCALALVHVEEVVPAFAEFARVLRPGGRVVISDVHPFLVMLGWQAQFPTGDGAHGFMRLHCHLVSEYTAAARATGLVVRSLQEPRLTEAAIVTAAANVLPDANRCAYLGLPALTVWDLERS
jgi:ubiquinone/menaquinone biosynthesis C-methylase UbiE